MSSVLRLAVCLFPDVTVLDYQGPVELLSHISPKRLETTGSSFKTVPSCTIEATYLSYTLDPVEPVSGPPVQPSQTYDSVEAGDQFDILLVPGGPGARPNRVKESLINFIKRQAPGAKYVLSVCTGSWILATAGILNGKNATSNKAAFNAVKEATKDLSINWIAKARWVADGDGKIWTSSGVTAGMDMACAFLKHLIGEGNAEVITTFVELSPRVADDDEFAAYNRLL